MDVDTFLTHVFVLVDDFCKGQPTPAPRPGPAPSLSRSEVVTLALLSQWQCFVSERGFYRYAEQHLRAAFPRLPTRSQFNRLLRAQQPLLCACTLYLCQALARVPSAYEAVDSTAVATRAIKRRGAGWLAGLTDVGWSNRLGWYEGFHLLLAVTPEGVITGYGFGAASSQDHRLAETFLALRAQAQPALPSVGRPRSGVYVADMGFAGEKPHAQWRALYRAELISPPTHSSLRPWPKPWRRRLAGLRQIVETVNARLRGMVTSHTKR